MFEIKSTKRKNIENLAATSLLENVTLDSFLNKTATLREISLCPTNAINLEKQSINENCISCGLCWAVAPETIVPGTPDKMRFLDFCNHDKKFVYTWLALITKNYCATEVKSSGFSRTKRMPLLIIEGNKLYLVKALRSAKEVEYRLAELEDAIDLDRKQLQALNLKRTLVLVEVNPEYSQYLNKFKSSITILSLEKTYLDFLKRGRQQFSEYVQINGV